MSATSVGEQLKQARSALRLTLQDVTRVTKIQPWVLEALEADRLHTTMSPVYVRGFLVSYAKCVRLDPDPLLSQLFPPVAQPPAEAPEAPVIKEKVVEESAHVAPSLQDVWSDLVVQLRRWLGVVSHLPVRRLGVVAVALLGAMVLVKSNPLRLMTMRVRPQEATVSVVPPPAKPPDEAPLALEAAQPLELAITARRSTWVSVKVDGQLLASQQLKSGSQEGWKARKRFEVIIAKPSQVDVLLNGQPINPFVMAHGGRLVITHKAIIPLADSSP